MPGGHRRDCGVSGRTQERHTTTDDIRRGVSIYTPHLTTQGPSETHHVLIRCGLSIYTPHVMTSGVDSGVVSLFKTQERQSTAYDIRCGVGGLVARAHRRLVVTKAPCLVLAGLRRVATQAQGTFSGLGGLVPKSCAGVACQGSLSQAASAKLPQPSCLSQAASTKLLQLSCPSVPRIGSSVTRHVGEDHALS